MARDDGDVVAVAARSDPAARPEREVTQLALDAARDGAAATRADEFDA